MKALIMAAGVGTRISRHLGDVPKCCAPIGEETILQRSIQMLKKYGIDDITLILGFQADRVHREVARFEVKTYFNPFFDITNSIASLWFARRELETGDDVLVMNGDLFFEEELMPEVVGATEDRVVFADPRRKVEADYRLNYKDGFLKAFGKTLSLQETTGEYIGIAKVRSSYLRIFHEHLLALMAEQRHGLWWEDVLFDRCARGDAIFVKEISDIFWSEIDYWEDYLRIQDFLRRGSTRVSPRLALYRSS